MDEALRVFLKESVESMRANLDASMSKKRDALLAKQGNLQPSVLAKDKPMVEIAKNSNHAKALQDLIDVEKTK